MVGESNGQPQLFQRVSVKIPIQSIRNANYDVDSFKEMVNKTMGLTSEVGLSVKPIKVKVWKMHGVTLTPEVVQLLLENTLHLMQWNQLIHMV